MANFIGSDNGMWLSVKKLFSVHNKTFMDEMMC